MNKYTVYDNRTDFPIIVDGTARECAELMRMNLSSFYTAGYKSRCGRVKRWTILVRRSRPRLKKH